MFSPKNQNNQFAIVNMFFFFFPTTRWTTARPIPPTARLQEAWRAADNAGEPDEDEREMDVNIFLFFSKINK